MTITKEGDITYRIGSIGDWHVPIVEFAGSKMNVSTLVPGTIGNSAPTSPTGKKITRDWKPRVAAGVKAVRGDGPWSETLRYVISLGMTFNLKNHYYQKFDVENFVKPVLDAVAAGLFCDEDKDPQDIDLWNFDDSNFRTLLIHRLPDTPDPRSEGVAIFVSAQ